MNTSWGTIRQMARDMRAWQASSTTQDERFLRARNLALNYFAAHLPEALVPTIEHVVLHPDVTGSDAAVDARLNATTDERVLHFTTSTGAELASAGSTGWIPKTDGTWDGLMDLEITLGNGDVVRRRAVEFWRKLILDGDDEFYVTIDRPWADLNDRLLDFRIAQGRFPLRADIVRVHGPGELFDDTRRRVGMVSAGDARRASMKDYRGTVKGVPSAIWPGEFFALHTPTRTPTVTPRDQPGWAGPVQEGDFKFYYTLAWGVRTDEWQRAPGGVADPLWESAPSPASSVFSHDSNPGAAIDIQTVNIDAMLDFGDPSLLREGHSGIRVRLYVERSAVRTSGLGSSWANYVEYDSRPYLLTEFDPSDNVGIFTWDGSVTPDVLRPMPYINGYTDWHFYPYPDKRYILDLPIVRRPGPIYVDNEVAPIDAAYLPAFLEVLLAYIARLDGMDEEMYLSHMRNFREEVREVRAAVGNKTRVVHPTRTIVSSGPKAEVLMTTLKTE